MKKILLSLSMWWICMVPLVAQDAEIIRGRVSSSEDKLPLPGASIQVKDHSILVIADENGEFELELNEGSYEFLVSFIGFETWKSTVEVPLQETLSIRLIPSGLELEGVEVLSTGYQKLPKERITGSFVGVGNELVNRSTSPDIVSRLANVTSGLIVNPMAGPGEQLSIRGRGTLYASTQPLIVVDNFPYDGPIENINPNDVESVTVLRDAAAASIWGARAGNGVIVITTKNGAYNQPIKVSFNTNTTVFERPNAFYAPQMGAGDFLEVEELLFSRGYYNSIINSYNHQPITPGVTVMEALRNGELSESEADRQLSVLRGQDIRKDINRYIYQPQIDQQYAVQVNGGGERQRFGISVGYDASRGNLQGNSSERITFKGNQELKFWEDRITFSNQLAWIQQGRSQSNQDVGSLDFSPGTRVYPYGQLADEAGNPLPLIKDYRRAFVVEAEQQGLLNWEYVPLLDRGQRKEDFSSTEIRWTTGLTYQILDGLQAELSYQYWNNQSVAQTEHGLESYFARDLINTFTQVDDDGALSYPVPKGGILDRNNSSGRSHQFRSLLRYGMTKGKHQLNVLGGFEAKDNQFNSYGNRYYGYNPTLASSIPVDLVNTYPYYNNPYLARPLPNSAGLSDRSDRFLSYYGNLGYTYDQKVDLTLSTRKDQSNLFGVRSNQRGVPLYSLGLGWTLSEMGFYGWEKLPYLKLRGSYGYNGNIDKSLTGETTALFLTSSFFGYNPGVPYARIMNPPYPDLRWERIGIVNLGLDFESRSGRISGSAEYYWKKGMDLISNTQLPPSSGLGSFRGNAANSAGQGFDLILNTQNIQGKFNWNTHWLFSTNREIVSKYLLEEPINNVLMDGATGFGVISPVEGYPLYPVFSYRWAGLDPDTGDPRGYLDGNPSSNYPGIIQASDLESLIYHGSARPTVYGSIRNTLQWKGLAVSFNITYKLGYYYRRNSVLYENLLTGEPDHSDYALRWQNPGDELRTNVPSIPEARNYNRDQLYRYSEALVEKGDHIRFQDINVSYRFPAVGSSISFISGLEVYSYLNNLGMIWKASSDPLDPEYRNLNPMRSYAVGLRASF
ncbi:SusC/RagA family TonB-linked outer membrane protein [Algoriphagus aquimarinus]|uniref:SusC/RagA family TonB-linked outer membrane protein n=1 Tax=Algoriphagus aquimarinus TaxID=237018 RepID=UPI0030DB8D2B